MKNFEEWLEELPLQTLTDELKEDIIEEHKKELETTYTEQELKTILQKFKNEFDKPCYTTQQSLVRQDGEYKQRLSIDTLFPWELFYKEYLKTEKHE